MKAGYAHVIATLAPWVAVASPATSGQGRFATGRVVYCAVSALLVLAGWLMRRYPDIGMFMVQAPWAQFDRKIEARVNRVCGAAMIFWGLFGLSG